MKSGILAYNNGQIYYEVTGSGEPMVFVHGFSLDHNMWRPQVKAFSETHQVITYDARGFGTSSLPDGPYDHVADLCALLSYLDIERAHIIGLSMGGRIATNFALAYPDMTRSLVLMDAALSGYANEVDWSVRAKEEGLERARENWLNHEVFSAAREQPEVAATLRAIVADYSGWHWLHNDVQKPSKIHVPKHLHRITQPTLIIVGEKDLPYFHNIATVLAAGIKNAQTVVIPGVGHMVNMEAPDAVNTLLTKFIAKLL